MAILEKNKLLSTHKLETVNHQLFINSNKLVLEQIIKNDTLKLTVEELDF